MLRRSLCPLRRQLRYIMTSPIDLAKAEEQLRSNPYYEKYATKIQTTAQKNPKEFEEKLMAVVKSQEKTVSSATGERTTTEYPQTKVKSSATPPVLNKRKRLQDIMNLTLLEGKSEEEIDAIWKEYYKSKDNVIFASLSKAKFNAFNDNCCEFPTFIVPLPRGDGFEFFISQYMDEEIHFAPLALYQRHKEDCPQCLCVSYFSELSQDIVLVLGEYDNNMLSPIEATCLLNSFQVFYNMPDQLALVKEFNKSPTTFDYNELIKQMNSFSIKS